MYVSPAWVSFHTYSYIETIYDEPSLPDPIYQELDIKQVDVEMVDNHSYNMAGKLMTFRINECPAYANNLNPDAQT